MKNHGLQGIWNEHTKPPRASKDTGTVTTRSGGECRISCPGIESAQIRERKLATCSGLVAH